MVEWVMTIFSNNANVDITSRIWDLYMIEGIKAIYQAAIAIFTIRERDILNSDYCDCIKAVKYSLTEPNSIDEDTLINKMKETKFSDADLFEIQKLNDEYIPIY